jgi:hypothetical protein
MIVLAGNRDGGWDGFGHLSRKGRARQVGQPAVQAGRQHALQDLIGRLQRVVQDALGAGHQDGVITHRIHNLADRALHKRGGDDHQEDLAKGRHLADVTRGTQVLGQRVPLEVCIVLVLLVDLAHHLWLQRPQQHIMAHARGMQRQRGAPRAAAQHANVGALAAQTRAAAALCAAASCRHGGFWGRLRCQWQPTGWDRAGGERRMLGSDGGQHVAGQELSRVVQPARLAGDCGPTPLQEWMQVQQGDANMQAALNAGVDQQGLASCAGGAARPGAFTGQSALLRLYPRAAPPGAVRQGLTWRRTELECGATRAGCPVGWGEGLPVRLRRRQPGWRSMPGVRTAGTGAAAAGAGGSRGMARCARRHQPFYLTITSTCVHVVCMLSACRVHWCASPHRRQRRQRQQRRRRVVAGTSGPLLGGIQHGWHTQSVILTGLAVPGAATASLVGGRGQQWRRSTGRAELAARVLVRTPHKPCAGLQGRGGRQQGDGRQVSRL